MKSHAFFYSKNPNWFSVEKICTQIVKAYEKFLPSSSSLYFHYYDGISPYELREMAQQLLKVQPKKLIFPDHSPSPFKLLRFLFELAPEYSPEITIHIYGNFVRYFSKWILESKGIKDRKIQFVIASQAHAKFLAPCFSNENQIKVCPFPVKTEAYGFNQQARIKRRQELGWEDNHFAFILTGRKSMQKNFLKTIELFSICAEKYPDIRLIALGDFDESAPPLFNEFYCRKEGQFFQVWQNFFEKISQNVRSKITLLPHISEKDLSSYLSASDAFISLSLHHFEDFGLSPIEALSSGLPTILTGWGGHLDHINHHPYKTHQVPVHHDQNGLMFDETEALNQMETVLKKAPFTPEQRKIAQEECAQFYSVDQVSKELLKLQNQPFPLFNGFKKAFERKNLQTIANTKDLNYHSYIQGFYES